MKTLKFYVAPKHIQRGMPYRISCCPIALAVKEKLGPDNDVMVTQSHIHVRTPVVVDYKFVCKTYGLSKRAQAFVRDFDRGSGVDPSCFVAVEE